MAENGARSDLPKLLIALDEDTKKELYIEFMKLAREAIEETTKNITINTRYVSQKQLMEMFQCGLPVIREWEAHGLKYFMKGKSKYYDLKDVAAVIDLLKI